MAIENKPTTPKHDNSVIAGKDNRTQLEKDKQHTSHKDDSKKDALGKSTNKSGDCS